MKKYLLVSLAALAATSVVSASAADLPSRKAAPFYAPPAASWTGFYAGLNAGYGWGTNNNTYTSLWNSGSWADYEISSGTNSDAGPIVGGAFGTNRMGMTQSGFIGGAQFGYNFQWKQNFVIGFETDIQGSGMRGGSNAYGVFGGGSDGGLLGLTSEWGNQQGLSGSAVSAGLDYFGTARGRIGYLMTPSLLIYGTGGLAYGGAWANATTNGAANTAVIWTGLFGGGSYSVNQIFVGGGRASALLVGYSAGGGAEWMFMPNWSLKFEGLYYSLGNLNVSTTALAPPAFGAPGTGENIGYMAYAGLGFLGGATSVNYQGVIARAGVNHHFNWGTAPVVASY